MKKCENCQWFYQYKDEVIKEQQELVDSLQKIVDRPWWGRLLYSRYTITELEFARMRLEEYKTQGGCRLNPKVVIVNRTDLCSHHTPVTPKQLLGDHTK
jgi:hypothetical protein